MGFVGTNNVTAAVFLLLRTQDVAPDVFICPSSNGVRENFGGGSNSAQSRSNFTKLPDNLSYSYANPYPDDAAVSNGYRLGTTTRSDFALGADLNPGKQGNYDVTAPTPTSSQRDMRLANSANHSKAGQNVLFNDAHVAWEQDPFVGVQRDNIYTCSGSTDGSAPTSATIVDTPKWPGDSVLLPALGN
jgi:hypothetical protein